LYFSNKCDQNIIVSDIISNSEPSRESSTNRVPVEVEFDPEQLQVTQTLVSQFLDLPQSQTQEMGIYLYGKRIPGQGNVKTVVEAAFPSQQLDSNHFDLSSEAAANEVAEMLPIQQRFGRELIGIVHTHPKEASTYQRQNFSPKGHSHNPDESFHDNIVKKSPGFLFGLAYPGQSGIDIKFLHSGTDFNSPQVIRQTPR
jgi:hypothetical protein